MTTPKLGRKFDPTVTVTFHIPDEMRARVDEELPKSVSLSGTRAEAIVAQIVGWAIMDGECEQPADKWSWPEKQPLPDERRWVSQFPNG